MHIPCKYCDLVKRLAWNLIKSFYNSIFHHYRDLWCYFRYYHLNEKDEILLLIPWNPKSIFSHHFISPWIKIITHIHNEIIIYNTWNTNKRLNRYYFALNELYYEYLGIYQPRKQLIWLKCAIINLLILSDFALFYSDLNL